MIIVQITDTHIKPPGRLAYRRVDTAPFLERAVTAILALTPRPDVILATGDLVDAGDAEEYERLLDLLRPLDIPLFAVPGNHDERTGLAKAFPDLAARVGGSPFFHYTVEEWPVRLIAMDTVLPGSGAGEVCAERLGWLDARLAEQPDRPTIIFQHHPPFDTGIGHMDRLGLSGADAMAAVVCRHSQVERVLCGHLHRPIQVRWAGTIACTAPSTAHQVALDLRDDAPSAFVMEPPGYQIHMWRADTGVVSHTAMVGDYDGPYPFFKDGKLID